MVKFIQQSQTILNDSVSENTYQQALSFFLFSPSALKSSCQCMEVESQSIPVGNPIALEYQDQNDNIPQQMDEEQEVAGAPPPHQQHQHNHYVLENQVQNVKMIKTPCIQIDKWGFCRIIFTDPVKNPEYYSVTSLHLDDIDEMDVDRIKRTVKFILQPRSGVTQIIEVSDEFLQIYWAYNHALIERKREKMMRIAYVEDMLTIMKDIINSCPGSIDRNDSSLSSLGAMR